MQRTTKKGLAAFIVVLAPLAAQACSGASTSSLVDPASADDASVSPVCVPGAQTACACPRGEQGVQVCRDDGRALGPCHCEGDTLVDGSALDGAHVDDASDGPHDGALLDGASDAKADAFDAAPFDANTLLDAGCTAVAAKREPTYLLIALDGSGSMSTDNKWTAVTPALDALFDDLRAQADTSLGVGLIVFSDSLDPTSGNGPYPSSRDVRIAFVDQAQHDALRSRVDTAAPMNATPTYAVLTGAFKSLESFVPASPLPASGKKVLLLLTDGVPTSSPPFPFDGGTEQDNCVSVTSAETAKAPPLGPITTFVVGTGPFPSSDLSNYDPTFLGKLAMAGGAAPQGCHPLENANPAGLCYYQVTPGGKPPAQVKDEFAGAINKIRAAMASCDLGILGSVDPSRFNVVLADGSGGSVVVPQGAGNGWTFDNPAAPTRVILHGTACTSLRENARAEVSFLEGCPTTH